MNTYTIVKRSPEMIAKGFTKYAACKHMSNGEVLAEYTSNDIVSLVAHREAAGATVYFNDAARVDYFNALPSDVKELAKL